MLRLTLFGSFALTRPDGTEHPLSSRKAKALLAYLALSPRQTRSREEIMALLWSERAEAQARGSLRQVLSTLRRELGAVLLADNDKVSLNPEQIILSPDRDGDLLAGFHLNDPEFEDWLRDERTGLETPPEDQTPPDQSEFGTPDLAVLPFDTLPNDAEKEAFSDGITEDIVTELARFKEFVTYSPWSSFHYRDDEMTTEEIGHDLEVDYLVEGSVRHANGRVRITAMLFDMETGNHVWVQRYDRALDDVFAIQDEVARDVATAVALRIETDAYELAKTRAPHDLTATDLVLLGEYVQEQDWTAGIAAQHYEQALRLDPTCARAYANLANWHATSPLILFTPVEEAQERTRKLADQALDHAPGDALVLAILSDTYATIGEFDLARQCLDKAIRANPNHHGVMGFAAGTLPKLGNATGALEWLERYLRHEPRWQTAAMDVSFFVYYLLERYEDALSSIARLSDGPLYLLPLAAAAHAQCNRIEEAEALRDRYLAALPPGQSFNTHILRATQTCTDQPLVNLWLDGFRKAGFEF